MRGDEEIDRYRMQVQNAQAQERACAAVISGALETAHFGPEESIDSDDTEEERSGKVLLE